MARFLPNCRVFLQNIVRSQLLCNSGASRRWCSSEHTLAVKKMIDDTKEKALQSGGERRIAKQHKKVSSKSRDCVCVVPGDLGLSRSRPE